MNNNNYQTSYASNNNSAPLALARSLTIGFIVGWVAWLPRALDAQSTSRIQPPSARTNPPIVQLAPAKNCTSCRLEMRKVATLRDGDVNLAASEVVVTRESAGNFIVATSDGEIGVFNTQGAFVRRMGRKGAGPSEFLRPFFISLGRMDSVFVADRGARRVTGFDKSLTRMARTFPMSSIYELIALPNGKFVASGMVSGEASSGLSVHLLNEEGAVLKSAISGQPIFGVGSIVGLSASLVHAPNASILAAPARRYQIERWSRDLSVRSVYVRSVPWFPSVPFDTPMDLPNRRPMTPTLLGLLGDSTSNTVFTVVRTGKQPFVPDPTLKSSRKEAGASMLPRMSELDRYVDTYIEAFDLGSATVLTTRRLPSAYRPVHGTIRGLSGPLVWRFKADGDDEEVLEIFELLIRR